MTTSKPSFIGHRQRIRDKYQKDGLNGFLDYEIVELLLTFGTPRRDCKNQAKELVKKFGSLKNILDANSTDLTSIIGIGNASCIGISIYKELMQRYFRDVSECKLALNNPADISRYLQQKIGSTKKERLYILLLDAQKKLIDFEISVGILNANLVHPREVFEVAIKNHAAQIVLAHNHPSGDIVPSTADIVSTRRLIEAGKIIGIEVIDHLIITRDSFCSMKLKGYI